MLLTRYITCIIITQGCYGTFRVDFSIFETLILTQKLTNSANLVQLDEVKCICSWPSWKMAAILDFRFTEYLYNKGKTRNLERDGIILAEFGNFAIMPSNCFCMMSRFYANSTGRFRERKQHLTHTLRLPTVSATHQNGCGFFASCKHCLSSIRRAKFGHLSSSLAA